MFCRWPQESCIWGSHRSLQVDLQSSRKPYVQAVTSHRPLFVSDVVALFSLSVSTKAIEHAIASAIVARKLYVAQTLQKMKLAEQQRWEYRCNNPTTPLLGDDIVTMCLIGWFIDCNKTKWEWHWINRCAIYSTSCFLAGVHTSVSNHSNMFGYSSRRGSKNALISSSLYLIDQWISANVISGLFASHQ